MHTVLEARGLVREGLVFCAQRERVGYQLRRTWSWVIFILFSRRGPNTSCVDQLRRPNYAAVFDDTLIMALSRSTFLIHVHGQFS